MTPFSKKSPLRPFPPLFSTPSHNPRFRRPPPPTSPPPFVPQAPGSRIFIERDLDQLPAVRLARFGDGTPGPFHVENRIFVRAHAGDEAGVCVRSVPALARVLARHWDAAVSVNWFDECGAELPGLTLKRAQSVPLTRDGTCLLRFKPSGNLTSTRVRRSLGGSTMENVRIAVCVRQGGPDGPVFRHLETEWLRIATKAPEMRKGLLEKGDVASESMDTVEVEDAVELATECLVSMAAATIARATEAATRAAEATATMTATRVRTDWVQREEPLSWGEDVLASDQVRVAPRATPGCASSVLVCGGWPATPASSSFSSSSSSPLVWLSSTAAPSVSSPSMELWRRGAPRDDESPGRAAWVDASETKRCDWNAPEEHAGSARLGAVRGLRWGGGSEWSGVVSGVGPFSFVGAAPRLNATGSVGPERPAAMRDDAEEAEARSSCPGPVRGRTSPWARGGGSFGGGAGGSAADAHAPFPLSRERSG